MSMHEQGKPQPRRSQGARQPALTDRCPWRCACLRARPQCAPGEQNGEYHGESFLHMLTAQACFGMKKYSRASRFRGYRITTTLGRGNVGTCPNASANFLLFACPTHKESSAPSLRSTSRGKSTWDVCEYLLGFEGFGPLPHILVEVLACLR